MKIGFYVDIRVGHGLGHLFRCFRIAKFYQNQSIEIEFIYDHENEIAQNLITTKGFNYRKLDDLEDIDLLFFDHYEPDKIIYSFITSPKTIIQINDFPQEVYPGVDYVINHCGNFTTKDFQFSAPNQVSFTGLEYAIIRKEFLENKQSDENSKHQITVILGGSDPLNITPQVIEIIKENRFKENITVISSKNNENLQLLDSTITVKTDLEIDELIHEFLNSKFIISSSSTVAYEIIALQIPIVIIQYIQNQENLYNYLSHVINPLAVIYNKGFNENLSDCLRKIEPLIQNQKDKKEFPIGKKLDRALYKIICDHQLEIKLAQEEHKDILYNLANDTTVRSNSINTDAIPYDSHVKWFKQLLQTENKKLLVAYYKGEFIGQVRFDMKEEIIINFSLKKEFRGLGLALPMVRKSTKLLLDLLANYKRLPFVAIVKKGNISSEKIFSQIGFIKSNEKLMINEEEYCKLIFEI